MRAKIAGEDGNLIRPTAWQYNMKRDMMTSSNGNIFRVTGPLCGEFTGPGEFPTQKPVTRSFDVFFDLRLNKRLSKQPWGWWFETLSCPVWRHGNVTDCIISLAQNALICLLSLLCETHWKTGSGSVIASQPSCYRITVIAKIVLVHHRKIFDGPFGVISS